jgi:hypothetical protein
MDKMDQSSRTGPAANLTPTLVNFAQGIAFVRLRATRRFALSSSAVGRRAFSLQAWISKRRRAPYLAPRISMSPDEDYVCGNTCKIFRLRSLPLSYAPNLSSQPSTLCVLVLVKCFPCNPTAAATGRAQHCL